LREWKRDAFARVDDAGVASQFPARAGDLNGPRFVEMTLIADRPPAGAYEAGAAKPAIVYVCAVLAPMRACGSSRPTWSVHGSFTGSMTRSYRSRGATGWPLRSRRQRGRWSLLNTRAKTITSPGAKRAADAHGDGEGPGGTNAAELRPLRGQGRARHRACRSPQSDRLYRP
jgi:hypothetical protein